MTAAAAPLLICNPDQLSHPTADAGRSGNAHWEDGRIVAVDPFGVTSFIALIIGTVLVIVGLYSRRHGKLRNREGAALLAGFAALVGVFVLGIGVYALLKA